MSTDQKSRRMPRPWQIGLGAGVVVLLLAIAGGIYWFGAGGVKSTNGPVTVPTLVATKTGKIFTIDSTQSTVTFTVQEVLFGNNNTVVGKTNQVAGQILVDTTTPSNSKVGEIKVDVSTLATDSNFRNQALQGHILETTNPNNQYAIFIPSSLSGLPASVTIGQPFSFQITGQLTLHGVTKPETFQTQATLNSATQLQGTAQTTVQYTDFNMSIPNVPAVTDVSKNVVLAINFVANA